MNDKFTVEEVNLICIFECEKSRTKVISDIKKRLSDLDDEMVELSKSGSCQVE